jgi:glycosyltransferase involved in cell wall biosynthesis
LIQKTNFPIEILIYDDASTDGTSDIIYEYQNKYPSLIFSVVQKENQFSKGAPLMMNFNCSRARGKYIALCEGDDYWTDPYKLQKQVDFLENNKDYSICFHPVKIIKEDGVINSFFFREVPETTNIYELAKSNYIHYASVMFRNFNMNKYLTDFLKRSKMPFCKDYFLYLYLAQYGLIGKLKDVSAIRRVHKGGMWGPIDQLDRIKKTKKSLKIFIPYFSYDKKIKKLLLNQYTNVIVGELNLKGNISEAKREFIKIFIKNPLNLKLLLLILASFLGYKNYMKIVKIYRRILTSINKFLFFDLFFRLL